MSICYVPSPPAIHQLSPHATVVGYISTPAVHMTGHALLRYTTNRLSARNSLYVCTCKWRPKR